MVTLTGSPFKKIQSRAETSEIVHFWLLVEVVGTVTAPPRVPKVARRLHVAAWGLAVRARFGVKVVEFGVQVSRV